VLITFKHHPFGYQIARDGAKRDEVVIDTINTDNFTIGGLKFLIKAIQYEAKSNSGDRDYSTNLLPELKQALTEILSSKQKILEHEKRLKYPHHMNNNHDPKHNDNTKYKFMVLGYPPNDPYLY
jgi:hypothetical protein